VGGRLAVKLIQSTGNINKSVCKKTSGPTGSIMASRYRPTLTLTLTGGAGGLFMYATLMMHAFPREKWWKLSSRPTTPSTP